MHALLTSRLDELRAEYKTGQKMLADLEQRRQELHETVLRISGAIQVLEELLARDEARPVELVTNGFEH